MAREKMILRNWLKNRSEESAYLLAIFDKEYQEDNCHCVAEEIISNGSISINLKSHKVYISQKEMYLSRKTYTLLEYFIRNKGRCIEHKEVLKNVWGNAHVNDTQYLRVFITKLRRSILDTESIIIESISGVGYKMNIIEEEK